MIKNYLKVAMRNPVKEQGLCPHQYIRYGHRHGLLHDSVFAYRLQYRV